MIFRLLTAMTLVFTSQAALAISYSLHDFGGSVFDEHNNTSLLSYPGLGYVPSPGRGRGELYDLEGLQVAVDDDYVHIALASSFAFRVGNLRIGDLFIGTDGGDPFRYAIDIQEVAPGSSGSFGFYEVASWNGLQDVPGSYGYSRYNDRRDITGQSGAHEIGSGAQTGAADYSLNFFADSEPDPLGGGNDDTYLWEFRLQRDLFGAFSVLDFHVVVGCGNDLLEESFELADIRIEDRPPQIPEPSVTLMLVAGFAGFLGIGYWLRQPLMP